MSQGVTRIVRAFITVVTAVSLLCFAAACTSKSSSEPSASASATATTNGKVAMFLPSNSVNLSSNVPLNTWDDLSDALTDSLKNNGIDDDDIQRTTSSDLDKQSDAISSYVSKRTADTSAELSATQKAENSATTLIVAPAVSLDKTYGEYSHFITVSSQESSKQDSSSTKDVESTAIQTIASALNDAKKAGIHVIIIANPIDGFVPDVFVPLVTAEDIGRMQAQQVASKLDLDSATSTNPKAIEVLMPVADSKSDDTTFQEEAFKGIWDVLGPYFRQRKAYSPSQKLSSFTTDADYAAVTFEATKESQAETEVKNRLKKTEDSSSAVRIDGIISMNDFVASGAIKALKSMGYTGSSMDVNPSITIFDVVSNIAGRKALTKQRVPDPAKTSDSDDADEQGESQETQAKSTQWPIITGFGAYVTDVPNIVDGLQWMTGLVDIRTNAQSIAQLCQVLNNKGKLSSVKEVKTTEEYGSKVPTLHLTLLAVSAANLKAALIDPGYISLADANM